MCVLLKKKYYPSYGLLLAHAFHRFTNIHSCPITGYIYGRNMYIDVLPSVFPLGIYQIKVEFFVGYPYEHMGTVYLYIDVFEEKKYKA